jgi:putative transposase
MKMLKQAYTIEFKELAVKRIKASTFEYIEVFYAPKEVLLEGNRKRQHSTLGYKSSVQFLENRIREQHQKKLVA